MEADIQPDPDDGERGPPKEEMAKSEAPEPPLPEEEKKKEKKREKKQKKRKKEKKKGKKNEKKEKKKAKKKEEKEEEKKEEDNEGEQKKEGKPPKKPRLLPPPPLNMLEEAADGVEPPKIELEAGVADPTKPKAEEVGTDAKAIDSLLAEGFVTIMAKRKEFENRQCKGLEEATVGDEDQKDKELDRAEAEDSEEEQDPGGQPSQERSNAKGLRGGGRSRTTDSNQISSPFLRLENPARTNACFVNSVLQLLQTLDLTGQLSEDPQTPVCSALYKLYKKKDEEQSKHIRTMVAEISGKDYFDDNSQQDASSFLQALEKIISLELATPEADRGHQGERCIRRHFLSQPGGRCPRCNTTPNTDTQPFVQLPVNIPRGANHSLSSVMANYFALNNNIDPIKCSTCCTHDEAGRGQECTCSRFPAQERTCLTKFPNHLLIQLVRFTNEGRKDKTPVTLEEEFLVDGVMYKLEGAVVHVGSSLNSGHYQAYINHDGEWYLHNDDDQARQVGLNNIDKKSTYLLVAKKKEGAQEPNQGQEVVGDPQAGR